jgi:Flp pilus assembly protein TadG
MMKLRKVRRREEAQSLAEFALILPVFLILVFGIIDFGMGLRAYITVAQATREGARYGIVGNQAGTFTVGGTGDCNGTTTTSIVGKVCSTMGGLDLTDLQTVTTTCPVTLTTPPCNPGDAIQVHAEYRYHYITPVRSLVNVLSGGSMPGYITVSSTTTMRQE